MSGLFGYMAVFILGVICGAVFGKKTGHGNGNTGENGGLFSKFNMNRNQGMVNRQVQGNTMMNQGMPRPGLQNRTPMPPQGQNQFNPPGGYGNQNNQNNMNNNGGW